MISSTEGSATGALGADPGSLVSGGRGQGREERWGERGSGVRATRTAVCTPVRRACNPVPQRQIFATCNDLNNLPHLPAAARAMVPVRTGAARAAGR